jgi:hypothetical protein
MRPFRIFIYFVIISILQHLPLIVGNPVSLSRFLLLFPFDDLHPARLSVASRGNANGERKTSNFMKLSGALILEVIVLKTMSHMSHQRFGDKLMTTVSNLVC